MNVLGLDLSLSGTGVVSNGIPSTIKYKWKTGDREEPRMNHILDTVLDQALAADLVVVEGLAFASKTGKVTERAGMWWLVAFNLWKQGVPLAVVPPTTLKSYILGKGVGDKDEMLIATMGHFPTCGVKNNNESDAYGLYAMGKDRVGEPLKDMPAKNKLALTKSKWPEGF